MEHILKAEEVLRTASTANVTRLAATVTVPSPDGCPPNGAQHPHVLHRCTKKVYNDQSAISSAPKPQTK
tara:strand:+ start:1957 stop:2163 length:207 start_codon:yes stop_codon:yes gene_type:complete